MLKLSECKSKYDVLNTVQSIFLKEGVSSKKSDKFLTDIVNSKSLREAQYRASKLFEDVEGDDSAIANAMARDLANAIDDELGY